MNTAEEESAQFNCEVEGVPPPEISWLVNGVPIEGASVILLFWNLVLLHFEQKIASFVTVML